METVEFLVSDWSLKSVPISFCLLYGPGVKQLISLAITFLICEIVVMITAPPSLGFSRQEHWSGLPFPSPMHEGEKWKWSRSVVSNLLAFSPLYYLTWLGFFFFFCFWPCHASCWILAPQSEVELVPPALEAQSLNHWTAREVLVAGFLNIKCGSLPSKILRCLKVFKQQN